MITADDLQEGLPDDELRLYGDQPGPREWGADERALLRELWTVADLSASQIALRLPGRTRNSIIGKAHALGLVKPPRTKRGSRNDSTTGRVRKAFASKGDDTTLSRWVKNGPPLVEQLELVSGPRQVDPRLLNRPEVVAGRSRFWRKGISDPSEAAHVLVSGHSNAKIGRDVRKGRHRGYWIYTLSLEERATCPRSCHHFATCYGNNMPYANRFDHTDPLALQAAITRDVLRLLNMRPSRGVVRQGVLVRLHALGDFFSVRYVEFWRDLLVAYPRLAVYGYTARQPGTSIGDAIVAARDQLGFERFAIRHSDGGQAQDCTQSVRAVDEAVNAIVCPEQLGKTAACATCGLCWTTRRNIAFLEH